MRIRGGRRHEGTSEEARSVVNMQPCKSSVEEEKMWRSPRIIFRGITVFISVSEREGTKPNRESDIDYEQARERERERDVRIKLMYI